MRTNAGRDFQARVMGDPQSSGEGIYAAAHFLSVSSDAGAPQASDTVLPGRITSGPLAPKAAAFSHTEGTDSYTLTATFVFGAATTISKVGVEQPNGTLIYQSLLSTPVTGFSGDSVQITVTVTV